MAATQISAQALKNWLIKVGKDRAVLVKCWDAVSGWDPFIRLVWIALHIGGLGGAFASAKIFELLFRAEKAGKHLYDYLDDLDRRGQLNNMLKNIGIAMQLQRNAIKDLLDLERRFNLRKARPGAVNVNALYSALQGVRGFANLAHYAMYELIRVYGFDCPHNLGTTNRLRQKLQLLGLTPGQFALDELPYVDLAVWDL